MCLPGFHLARNENLLLHNGGHQKYVQEYCIIAIGKTVYLNGPVHLLFFIFITSVNFSIAGESIL